MHRNNKSKCFINVLKLQMYWHYLFKYRGFGYNLACLSPKYLPSTCKLVTYCIVSRLYAPKDLPTQVGLTVQSGVQITSNMHKKYTSDSDL